MSIKNTTHISKKTYLKYYAYTVISNFRLMVIILCMLLFGGLMIYLQMQVPSSMGITNTPVFTALILFLIIVLLVMIFLVTPLRSYKNVRGIVNSFSFEEEGISIETEKPGVNAQATYRYGTLIKVIERRDAFYFYIDKRRAFIVDKEGFTQGGTEQLRELLSVKIGKKYRV